MKPRGSIRDRVRQNEKDRKELFRHSVRVRRGAIDAAGEDWARTTWRRVPVWPSAKLPRRTRGVARRRPAHRRCRVVAIRAVRAFLSNKYVVDLAARSLLRLRRF